MPDNAVERFRARTGLPPEATTALGQLPDEDYERLADIYVHARNDLERKLDAAVENGLSIMPRLVRMPVRKILFG